MGRRAGASGQGRDQEAMPCEPMLVAGEGSTAEWTKKANIAGVGVGFEGGGGCPMRPGPSRREQSLEHKV